MVDAIIPTVPTMPGDEGWAPAMQQGLRQLLPRDLCTPHLVNCQGCLRNSQPHCLGRLDNRGVVARSSATLQQWPGSSVHAASCILQKEASGSKHQTSQVHAFNKPGAEGRTPAMLQKLQQPIAKSFAHATSFSLRKWFMEKLPNRP